MSDLPSCETLKLALDRGVLHVTLDRPETKNALNKAMVRDLTAAVDYLAAHQDMRAAVVRGANGTFCAGGDINGFKEMFSTPLPKPGERDGVALHNRALRRDHVALRGVAADDRDGGRRRGLWRRARPDVRRRRRAGGGGCEVLDLRDDARRAAGADRAVRGAAHRRRAHAAALAHRAPLRRARGGAARAGRSGLRRHGRARCGAGAGARRHRALLAARQRGDQAAHPRKPHDAARGTARAIGRRVRRMPARRGGDTRASRRSWKSANRNG